MSNINKNVLFLTAWFPANENKSAGVFIEEHASALNNIPALNVLVYHLYVLNGSGFLNVSSNIAERENNLKIRTLRIEGFMWKFVYYFPFILHYFVKNDLRKNPPFGGALEVVHANVIHPSGVIGFKLKNSLKAKFFLISEHWSKAHTYVKHPLFGNLAKKTYTGADLVLPVSAFLSRCISQAVGRGVNTRVIPNIVSSVFHFKQVEPSKTLKFICVSNWQSPKRPDLIFDSLELISRQSEIAIELFVVGKGPLIEKYKSQDFSFRTEYHDFLSKENLCGLFNNSSFMLLASDTETFSVIVAEALSCGLPVLASKRGAIPELLDDSSGLLVENDTLSWVAGLNEIISKTWDRKQIAAIHRPRFTIEKITDEFSSVYDSVFSSAE